MRSRPRVAQRVDGLVAQPAVDLRLLGIRRGRRRRCRRRVRRTRRSGPRSRGATLRASVRERRCDRRDRVRARSSSTPRTRRGTAPAGSRATRGRGRPAARARRTRDSIARPSAWNASPGIDTSRTGPSCHSTSSTGNDAALTSGGQQRRPQRDVDHALAHDLRTVDRERFRRASTASTASATSRPELFGLREPVAGAVVVLAVDVARVHVADRAREHHRGAAGPPFELGAERADPVARHREALRPERDGMDRDVGDRADARARRRRARRPPRSVGSYGRPRRLTREPVGQRPPTGAQRRGHGRGLGRARGRDAGARPAARGSRRASPSRGDGRPRSCWVPRACGCTT